MAEGSGRFVGWSRVCPTPGERRFCRLGQRTEEYSFNVLLSDGDRFLSAIPQGRPRPPNRCLRMVRSFIGKFSAGPPQQERGSYAAGYAAGMRVVGAPPAPDERPLM